MIGVERDGYPLVRIIKFDNPLKISILEHEKEVEITAEHEFFRYSRQFKNRCIIMFFNEAG